MSIDEHVNSILDRIDKGEIYKTVVLGYARFYITFFDEISNSDNSSTVIADSDIQLYQVCKKLLEVLTCH